MPVWEAYLKGYKAYLQLERSMADNTVGAYMHDVAMLGSFIHNTSVGLGIHAIELSHLQSFLGHINELELAAGTQARILSGIKSFFRYLMLEEVVQNDP